MIFLWLLVWLLSFNFFTNTYHEVKKLHRFTCKITDKDLKKSSILETTRLCNDDEKEVFKQTPMLYKQKVLLKKKLMRKLLDSSSNAMEIFTKIVVDDEIKVLKSIPPIPNLNITNMNWEIELNDFKETLKGYCKTLSVKKMLKLIENHARESTLNTNMTLIALKMFQRINRTDCYQPILNHFETSYCDQNMKTNQYLPFLHEVNASVGIVQFFCKVQKMECFEQFANASGFKRLLSSQLTYSSNQNEIFNQCLDQTGVLSDLILGYSMSKDINKSLQYLTLMHQRNVTIDLEISKKIFKNFLNYGDSLMIKDGLRYLLDLGGLSDVDSIHLITSRYLKSLEFVKGAVSMNTLPPAECPEIAFIGRSNVGKSSLINMICSRKSLAFISKTPGKTSEFNYFDGKGLIGIHQEPHRLYVVDLPGVGYAEKSRDLRSNWTKLLKSYMQERATLRVVFHLIDSRHGLLPADEECLDLLNIIPSSVRYVIVLTKVDKHRGSKSDKYEIRANAMQRVYDAISVRTNRSIPILLTSSESHIGGGEVWYQIIDGLRATD